jgi:hypothetical protein
MTSQEFHWNCGKEFFNHLELIHGMLVGGKMTRGITVVATMSSVMESAGSAILPANVFQAQVDMRVG